MQSLEVGDGSKVLLLLGNTHASSTYAADEHRQPVCKPTGAATLPFHNAIHLNTLGVDCYVHLGLASPHKKWVSCLSEASSEYT